MLEVKSKVETILAVKDLKKYFPMSKGLIFSKVVAEAKAVDGVSFTIPSGQTMAIVGESGCGKTTTTKLILRLEKADSGTVLFRGEDALNGSGEVLDRYRRGVQAVFQDPYSSLDPRMRVGDIVAEPLRGCTKADNAEIKAKVEEALHTVGLNRTALSLFPHEFSGGQRQRIAIARALALRPALIILDEPVSALDVSIRAQIMNLLKDLQAQLGLSYLLIAHDLATVRYMCDRVVIMYLGKIVESSAGEEIFEHPYHPYTKALLSAALPFRAEGREEVHLPGEVPSPYNPPSGCRFHNRCPQTMAICSEREPALKNAAQDHLVACHLISQSA